VTATTSPHPIPTNHCLGHALTYAEHGLPVIPIYPPRPDGSCTCHHHTACTSPGKHPIPSQGLSEATTNRVTIQMWWTEYPTANVAIVTGGPKRLVVLDIDPRHGGREGIARLEEQFGPLPPSFRISTGGGGEHIYLQGPPDVTIRNTANLGGQPGVDVRAGGGYVLAPPSVHSSGRLYTLHRADGVVEPIPPSWIELLRAPATAPAPADPSKHSKDTAKSSPRATSPLDPDSSTPYGLAALTGEVSAVREATQPGRNNRLNIAAYKLAGLILGGELDRGEAESALRQAGLDAGLGEIEVNRTIASGLAAPTASPRSAPESPSPEPTKLRIVAGGEKPAPAPVTQPVLQPSSAAPPDLSVFAPTTLGDLMATDIEYPEELVADDVLLRGCLYMMIGSSGCGKTLSVMALAEALGAGTSFLDRRVHRPCRVLWCSAEGGQPLLRKRLDVFKPAPAAYPHVMAETFERCPDGIPPKLLEPGERDRFIAFIQQHNADVVILDPLVLFNLGSDEISTKEMGLLAASLLAIRRTTNVALIVVHHTRKPPQTKVGYNPLDPSEARGAGVLVDLSDGIFAMHRKEDESGQADDYWFGYPKRRWGRRLPTVKLALDDASLRFSVVGEDSPNIGGKRGPSTADLRQTFEHSLPLGEPVSTAEATRRVAAYFVREKPKTKPPVHNTIRAWLESAAETGIVNKQIESGKYLWELK